ncbi:hypothetical protein B7R22_05275 [Subtercola boreus]|uniref:3-keto-disaccharide hydrolase domain-containing protein n=1 Tax=Subtercola boreus TaxID=120213 RepID=A0A3E0W211_9MICO|nr:hypothetical protein [Subtercola boreus]RFA15819.1 hypothetical protein B7R22_05275 [Subtercola boreus]
MATNNGTVINIAGTPDAGNTYADVPWLAEQITSDRATGGNAADINGRVLDALYGDDGTVHVWTSNVANAFAIVNGSIVRGSVTTSGQMTTTVSAADQEFGELVTILPAANGNAIYYDIRLNLAAGAAGARNSYRMKLVNLAGVVYIEMYRRTNASTLIGAAATWIVGVGDKIAIRAYGNKIMMLRNNILLETYLDVSTDYHPTGGFVGVESGTAANFGFTDIYIEKSLGPAPV